MPARPNSGGTLVGATPSVLTDPLRIEPVRLAGAGSRSHRFCDLARAFDQQLRRRAQGSILERDDCDRQLRYRQLDRQPLEGEEIRIKLQDGDRQSDDEAAGHAQAVADPLAAIGLVAHGSTPAEFAAAIEEQRVELSAIAQAFGLKPAD